MGTKLVKLPFLFFSFILLPLHSCAGAVFGTAFFYNKNGDMFTNKHVVDKCSNGSIKVRTADMKWHKARILAVDSKVDIAAISIDKEVDAYASFRLFPGTKNISVPEELEDVFSAGFSAPDKNNFQLQPKWGQIQGSKKSNSFPYVNIMRMDAYQGSSGSAVLDYYGLLIGIVFAISKDPVYDPKLMSKSGYGNKWIHIHNNNALLLFANQNALNYSVWDQWDKKDPIFILDHAKKISGFLSCYRP